jgi:signal transduction histidine kinase
MVKRQLSLLVLFVFSTAFHGTKVLWAASGQPRVLVVYSTRQDTQLPLLTDRNLPGILNNRLSRPVDYYAEYIDATRIPTRQQERAFRDYLRTKYRNQRFNLVIAMQDVAWDFVRKYRSALFPRTPVVFSSRNRNVPRPVNSTGVVSKINLRGTLDFALTLQPETKHVFVVTGASNRDKVYENLARAQLRGLESRVALTYLAGLPRTELEQRVATLPEKSIVYYLLFYQDRTGENQNPIDFLVRLTALANRPTYSWSDSTMDHGVVGGQLEDQSSLIEAVAETSARVLKGQRADTIPISTPDVTVAQVDWRQLQRWKISESRVPSGTSVLFRQDAPDGDDVQLAALWPVPLAVVLIAAMAVWTQRRRKTHGDQHGSPFGKIRLEDRLRDLGRRLLKAQEEERSRIALELHDDVSQQAVALAIDLQRINDSAQGSAQKIVRDAQKRVKSLLKSVHDLSHRLHPANLRLVGLLAALGQLQRDLSRPGITITVASENVAAILPDDIALCLFRIAQEAMQNAIKHSGARSIQVQLKGGQDAIALRIIDDGVGFDVEAAAGKGLGLISMLERAESVGGTLKVVSRKGAGTRLQVTVPCRTSQHQASSIAS